MQTRILAAGALIFLLVQGCVGAEFWEKKQYPEWSKTEAQRLLENSPWAQQVTLGAVNVNVSRNRVTGDERENTPRIIYTMQLRSAPIVRQAIIRMSQIEVKYDRMSPAQRARFDAKAGEYINSKDEDIVVYCSFTSNVQGLRMDLHNYWQRQTSDLLKPNTYLNAGGQKLPLVEFIRSGDEEFQLVFPRPSGISQKDVLGVEFQTPNASGGTERVLVQYPLKKMAVEGALQY
jgi:hypothetical protein